MRLSETDTCSKLTDPAIYARGVVRGSHQREERAGTFEGGERILPSTRQPVIYNRVAWARVRLL